MELDAIEMSPDVRAESLEVRVLPVVPDSDASVVARLDVVPVVPDSDAGVVAHLDSAASAVGRRGVRHVAKGGLPTTSGVNRIRATKLPRLNVCGAPLDAVDMDVAPRRAPASLVPGTVDGTVPGTVDGVVDRTENDKAVSDGGIEMAELERVLNLAYREELRDHDSEVLNLIAQLGVPSLLTCENGVGRSSMWCQRYILHLG